ncbi:MAG TPA: hypothetical protein PKD70_12475 [Saprospiraceae bacterium]|nr:hypothetical protein [Saprospiraceae bacterium]HMP14689.1 hypothetical protein [Saprospiraceae bacterium]
MKKNWSPPPPENDSEVTHRDPIVAPTSYPPLYYLNNTSVPEGTFEVGDSILFFVAEGVQADTFGSDI